MLAQVLRGIIIFIAVVSVLTVSAEEEKFASDEEFDLMNNGEEIEEDEEPSLDNAVDLREGLEGKNFHFFPEAMNLTLYQVEDKHEKTRFR